MEQIKLLKELSAISNELDNLGLYNQSNYIDRYMHRLSQVESPPPTNCPGSPNGFSHYFLTTISDAGLSKPKVTMKPDKATKGVKPGPVGTPKKANNKIYKQASWLSSILNGITSELGDIGSWFLNLANQFGKDFVKAAGEIASFLNKYEKYVALIVSLEGGNVSGSGLGAFASNRIAQTSAGNFDVKNIESMQMVQSQLSELQSLSGDCLFGYLTVWLNQPEWAKGAGLLPPESTLKTGEIIDAMTIALLPEFKRGGSANSSKNPNFDPALAAYLATAITANPNVVNIVKIGSPNSRLLSAYGNGQTIAQLVTAANSGQKTVNPSTGPVFTTNISNQQVQV